MTWAPRHSPVRPRFRKHSRTETESRGKVVKLAAIGAPTCSGLRFPRSRSAKLPRQADHSLPPLARGIRLRQQTPMSHFPSSPHDLPERPFCAYSLPQRSRSMNVELRSPQRAQQRGRRQSSIATFIRETSLEDLRPFLSNRWWDYLQTYGRRSRHGYVAGYPYPKMTPIASRRDAWPPGGGAARQRSRLHARAASRPLRHRLRDHESAPALGAGRHERRAQRGDGLRHQRVPARALAPPRAAAQGLGHRAL